MTRVLIVDDAQFMRTALKKILEKNNYEVVGEAENGEKAVELYKEIKPDLVTMDITMPVMDGLEALEKIIAMDKGAKVVMVSAMGQEKLVKKAIVMGAKYFLVKPFKEDSLIDVLNKVVSI
jgi:two-component system chemotaxis response regulator CheY